MAEKFLVEEMMAMENEDRKISRPAADWILP